MLLPKCPVLKKRFCLSLPLLETSKITRRKLDPNELFFIARNNTLLLNHCRSVLLWYAHTPTSVVYWLNE